MCSRDNGAYLESFLPELKGRVDDGFRAGIDTSSYEYRDQGREPFTLLFLGSFRHLPNQEALTWFLREVFPKVRVDEPRARLVIIGSGFFDLVDGAVARASNRVTRFGGFFDSVIDRYSDLALYFGLLVYYASINRFFYIVLTAIVMTGSVMISYTRARAENAIPKCKVGFLERPERVVLIIIGALFDRIAPMLWVIAILSNLTVVHRMIYTWQECKRLDVPRV